MQAAGDWSSSICSCCDSGVCCCACILPCVVLSQNVRSMQALGIDEIPVVDECMCLSQNKPLVAGMLYGSGMLANLIGVSVAPYAPYASNLSILQLCSVCLHSRIRGAIQKRLVNGNDDCILNFCRVWWCYSCALAQEQRHLEHVASTRGVPSVNEMDPLLSQDYAQPPPNSYAPAPNSYAQPPPNSYVPTPNSYAPYYYGEPAGNNWQSGMAPDTFGNGQMPGQNAMGPKNTMGGFY
jgi:Cys-rich protein (TIGR01571 family)